MKREPLTEDNVAGLRELVGPLMATIYGLDNIDFSRGRGIIEGSFDRVIWDKEGRKIQVGIITGDGIIVSRSKDPDPELPPPLAAEPAPVRCTHPDHVDGESCEDRAVGCDARCRCCMIEPVPVSQELDRLRSEVEQVRRERDEARELLRELYATVRGECPSLLNEDSGGDAELDLSISRALNPTPTTSEPYE